ncbi:MAG: hypothetical protein K6F80_06855 [Oscillospiraceae bacterium]|nr:hypothetical protein [Oscillospiraceae bacterium]
MNESDKKLKEKAAEIEALLNAYSAAHASPAPPPEPEPTEPIPEQEEVPLEADELPDLLMEEAAEEREEEIEAILTETEPPEPDAPDDADDSSDDDDVYGGYEEDDEYEEPEETEEEAEAEEEVEAEEEAEEERRISRFTRGCLEVAGFYAALAFLLLLLEQFGICIGYELPQLFLPLTMVAGSLLALTVCLYSALRKALASFVMVVSIWFLIMLYAITNFQFPEVIPTKLPETNKEIVLTQITTPINANLCVDEILIPGIVSRRFKMPVHPKYVPLRYQVQLLYNEETKCDELYYNDILWAVYTPNKNRWTNATRLGNMIVKETEPPPETVPQTRKPHRTGRSSTDKRKTTTTTTKTTTKRYEDQED